MGRELQMELLSGKEIKISIHVQIINIKDLMISNVNVSLFKVANRNHVYAYYLKQPP